jgi:hypothetical protein
MWVQHQCKHVMCLARSVSSCKWQKGNYDYCHFCHHTQVHAYNSNLKSPLVKLFEVVSDC